MEGALPLFPQEFSTGILSIVQKMLKSENKRFVLDFNNFRNKLTEISL